ncbi:Aldo/keto reductase [Hymenopellis radicata]|nr:Aldo/keto reductase [Hymenopellis radicata]
MSTITLKRTGREMPLVGFGTWKVRFLARYNNTAVKAGYRLLDGAGDYGNEKEVGEGVRRAIDEGIVKREDLFITSKLWNTFHDKERVEQLARKQLADWGLEYFDLFLIHFPISLEYVDPAHRYPPEWWGDDKQVHLGKATIQETWTEMEKLVDIGLAKNIGVSNFQPQLILDVLRYARYEPQVLQVEIHPYNSQSQLVDFCKVHGIAVTAYSSLGPQGYIEIAMDKSLPSLFSQKVLLRWSTQRGIAVIPKTEYPEYLQQNLDNLQFMLTDEEMKAINGLNVNVRLNDPALIDARLAIFA